MGNILTIIRTIDEECNSVLDCPYKEGVYSSSLSDEKGHSLRDNLDCSFRHGYNIDLTRDRSTFKESIISLYIRDIRFKNRVNDFFKYTESYFDKSKMNELSRLIELLTPLATIYENSVHKNNLKQANQAKEDMMTLLSKCSEYNPVWSAIQIKCKLYVMGKKEYCLLNKVSTIITYEADWEQKYINMVSIEHLK